MSSVQTDYHGRLANRQHLERLAGRIHLIGQAVHPALNATSRLVDTVLPWPVLVKVPDQDRFVEIGDVHVVGAELTLMDFRRDWHRFPFTFVRDVGRGHLALPRLEGTLVTVEDREECRFYMSPAIKAAQCYLAPYGTQHLRYQLEVEFDMLMAYVRFFHMPGLEYWCHGPLGWFTTYRKWATALREIPRGQRAVAAARESWRVAAKWPPDRAQRTYDLRDDVRAKLEAENTAEAIATGVLISHLCDAHMEYLP